MGKFLQIRVIAQTYDPVAAEERFAKLYALAWPAAATPPAGPRGLLELTQALDDAVRLGDLPGPERKALLPGVERAMVCKNALEGALADRDAHTADKRSYELEDALAELEKLAPKG
ncbi:hypothetical protein [Solidesulfovibrio sp.]|uniref:hypothetical protein n=1 Tax=Solidesulfovibrio sp. TaxID=2910990 RepID=UPI00260D1055|nr:hypothetical protein [Solidesulfovibrio sp.]